MPLKVVFSRPPKWVSTKTLLLKHYDRRQGKECSEMLVLVRKFKRSRKIQKA